MLQPVLPCHFRVDEVALLEVWATLFWALPTLAPPDSCQVANEDADAACNSRSVSPLGWLWRHDGSAGALAEFELGLSS